MTVAGVVGLAAISNGVIPALVAGIQVSTRSTGQHEILNRTAVAQAPE